MLIYLQFGGTNSALNSVVVFHTYPNFTADTHHLTEK